MIKVLILFISTAGLISGCNWARRFIPAIVPIGVTRTSALPPAIEENKIFENPSFPCPTDKAREPEGGYPTIIRQDTLEGKSVAELEEFCSRMRQRFSQSGMNVAEAAKIYAILKSDKNDKTPWLHNECYGMPLCDPEPFIFEKQIMIKKIDNKTYELFYYFIGCGTNYHHQLIFIEQDQIDRYELFERWSESYPC